MFDSEEELVSLLTMVGAVHLFVLNLDGLWNIGGQIRIHPLKLREFGCGEISDLINACISLNRRESSDQNPIDRPIRAV